MRACSFALLVALLLPTLAYAQSVIYVDADATGANDGSSWADAYSSLHVALEASSEGDQVWLAEGLYDAYRPELPAEEQSGFIAEGVAIYGGFDGTETAFEERDFEEHESTITLSAPIQFSSSDYLPEGQTSGSVVILAGMATADGILDGVAFRHCHNQGSATIYVSADEQFGFFVQGNTRIANCLFDRAADVATSQYRQEIKVYRSLEVDIENCHFQGEPSSGHTSVVHDERSRWTTDSQQMDLTISSCQFLYDSPSGLRALSEGYSSDNAHLEISDCHFQNLSSGIDWASHSIAIQGCSFTNMTAAIDVPNLYSGAEITECSFTDVSTAIFSGLLYGTLSIDNCQFLRCEKGVELEHVESSINTPSSKSPYFPG